jgi:hypothetical protein
MSSIAMSQVSFPNSSIRLLLTLAIGLGGTIGLGGCKPKAVRGGPGTENPNLDEGAMSTTLDRVDIEYLVDENLAAMFGSGWWARDIQGSMSNETKMVNSGAVSVVSRERQAEMVSEVQMQNSDLFDPATASRLGAQLGAKYYITGKLTSNEERLNDVRRVQYSLFIQVIEVETSLVKFQFTSERSKAIGR